MKLFDLLQQFKKGAHLNTARKEEIRADLAHFIETQEPVREAAPVRHIGQRSSIINLFLKPKPMPVFAVIALMALLGGGTTFAAQGALPGDILYPVKVHFNENVVDAFQFTPQAKASWDAKVAETRLEEAAKLAAEGRMNDTVRAELENGFEARAKNAKAHIREIEAQGNTAVAADEASQFEGLLKAHETVLGRIGAESTSTVENHDVASLNARVGAELNDVSELRVGLESKVEDDAQGDEQSKAIVKSAAEDKLNAAANVIAEAQSFVNAKKADIGAQASADAEARLAAANNLVAEGRTKLAAGDYALAFKLANQAIRVAQEAKLFANTGAELNLKIDLGGEDESEMHASTTERSGEEMRATSTEREDNGHMLESSSSVRVEGDAHGEKDDEGVKSGGDLKVNVGL